MFMLLTTIREKTKYLSGLCFKIIKVSTHMASRAHGQYIVGLELVLGLELGRWSRLILGLRSRAGLGRVSIKKTGIAN